MPQSWNSLVWRVATLIRVQLYVVYHTQLHTYQIELKPWCCGGGPGRAGPGNLPGPGSATLVR
jgi:hypothetical protein